MPQMTQIETWGRIRRRAVASKLTSAEDAARQRLDRRLTPDSGMMRA